MGYWFHRQQVSSGWRVAFHYWQDSWLPYGVTFHLGKSILALYWD